MRKFRLKITLLLLLSTFLLPARSQLFDDSDVKDPQGVLDHFRSRIKQVRSYIWFWLHLTPGCVGQTSYSSHSNLGLECLGLPVLGWGLRARERRGVQLQPKHHGPLQLCDVGHYCRPEHDQGHRIWISCCSPLAPHLFSRSPNTISTGESQSTKVPEHRQETQGSRGI